MKRNLTLFLFLLFLVSSCHQKDRQVPASENAEDAARNFIKAALDGDFQSARNYMVRDSNNEERMSAIERINYSPEERQGLMSSSIRIWSINNVVKDSESIVIYSNSYKNDKDTLKILKVNGKWLVDFKYLYEHDMDSMNQKPVKTDTAR